MIALLVMLLIALPVAAQSIDAGSVGRAGAHDLIVKSGSVLNWNPAVLGQSREFRWSLELPSLAAGVANNAFSVAYWNDHIAGDRFFTDADKADILDQIPDDGWRADVQGSVPLFGLTYNRFGVHATIETAASATAPREIIQLALYGNEIDRPYLMGDLAGDEQTFADYSAGFGYDFEQNWFRSLYFGAGFHFYHGLYLSKVVRSDGEFLTTDSTLTGSGVVHHVSSSIGDGVSFDLGTVAVLNGQWRVGLALRQIGARMTWQVDDNRRVSFYTDSTGVIVDSLNNRDYLERAMHWQDTTYSGGAVETQLPMIIQLNGRFTPHKDWAVLGDVSIRTRASVKGPAGLDAAVAGEYYATPWLIVQGGVGAGNLWGFHTGLGAGLRFRRYELDVGGAWNGGLFDSARGLAVGLTHRLKF